MKYLTTQDCRDEAEFRKEERMVRETGEPRRGIWGNVLRSESLDPWRTVLGGDDSLCGGKQQHFEVDEWEVEVTR